MEEKSQTTEYSGTKERFFEFFMTELKPLTQLEVNGKLDDKGIAITNDLRVTTKDLGVALGKDKVCAPQEWLMCGITDFISSEKLQECANLTKAPDAAEPNFQKTAKYFFEKRQRADLGNK